MANMSADGATVARTETYAEKDRCYYSWLEDYLKRLEARMSTESFRSLTIMRTSTTC